MAPKLDWINTGKPVFALCDADGDGNLTKDEILGLCGHFDPERDAESKFNSLCALIDTNNDGEVSFSEFQALMKQWTGSQAIEDRTHWAFNLFEHIRR